VDPENPQDPILSHLASRCLMVWIEGSETHTAELVRRFDRAPKPMAYRADFLLRMWTTYKAKHDLPEDRVDPDAFIRWTYAQALAHRQPLYAAMSRNWGVTVSAEDMARVGDEASFVEVVAEAMRMRGAA
jgi:hypothetical protein